MSRWQATPVAVVILGAALCAALPARAGRDAWTPIGPPGRPALTLDGGGVTGRVVVDPDDPSSVYAIAVEGLFQTGDGGATWSLVAPDLSSAFTAFLVIDTRAPASLWASLFTGRLARSTDGGQTFAPTSLSDITRAFAIDPTTGRLYALTHTAFVRSLDDGLTWAGSTPGSNQGLPAIVVDPHTPGTLYVGRGDVLSKSTDGGVTFEPTGWTTPFVSLTADAGNPITLYLTTYPDEAVPGSDVYRSIDGGLTWTPAGPGAGVATLVIDPTAPTNLYALSTDSSGPTPATRVHRSLNAGASWEPPVVVDAVLNHLAIDGTAESTLYAATSGQAVLRSIDGGTTWTMLGTGDGIITAYSLGLAPGALPTLHVGTDLGLFVSHDRATSWQAHGDFDSGPGLLAIDPSTPERLFGTGAGSLRRSLDGGDSWGEALHRTYPKTGFSALVIDPTDPQTIYAGISNGLGAGAVSVSRDGGDTWPEIVTFPQERQQLGQVNDLGVDPADGSVYAATSSPFFTNGIIRSTDAVHWTSLGLGDTTAFAIDPMSPATLYAAAGNGELFKSTDRGASWTSLGTPASGRRVGRLLVDPTAPLRVLAATDRGVLASGDGGATWGDLGPPRRVHAVTVDPSRPGILLAATERSGILEFELVSCNVDGDCEDGDACTIDTCDAEGQLHDARGCVHSPATGFLGADCLFAHALRGAPCAGVSFDLWNAVADRLGRARQLVAAAGEGRGRPQARSLRAARKTLLKIQRRLRRAWRNQECHVELGGITRDLRKTVAALSR